MTPDKVKIKDKRVQVYYDVVERVGKLGEYRKRYWLHQKNKKLYAYVRDNKQGVSVTADTVNLDVDIIFILNYNKHILEHYTDPIIIVFNGVHYKTAQAKPDQYEHYTKSDIKILAKRYTEVKEADEDIFIPSVIPPIAFVYSHLITSDNLQVADKNDNNILVKFA